MVRDTVDTTSDEKRPLVAIGYKTRFVPMKSLTDAIGGVCDLDWLDGFRNITVIIVGSVHDCAELHPVNRLLLEEVTVTHANVSHD